MMQQLLILIHDYLDHVRNAHRLFRNNLLIDEPLTAFRDGRLPKSGVLDSGADITYEFHGVGCRIQEGKLLVDFDYGPDGRHDGFDAWRLHVFATTARGYDAFTDMAILEEEMENLKRARMVFCPHWLPSPHLYYLAEHHDVGTKSIR